MSVPAFHLRAAPFCPTAEMVRITLALRGTKVVIEPIDKAGLDRPVLTELVVRQTGTAELRLSDPLAMVELIEDLHPDHPLHPADPLARAAHRAFMARAIAVEARLGAVVNARQPADLDIAIYKLNAALSATENEIGARAPGPSFNDASFDNVDVAFAPALWRLHVLDRFVRTYLLSGFNAMTAWADRVADHPILRSVLPPTDAARWLEQLAGDGAEVVALQADNPAVDSRPGVAQKKAFPSDAARRVLSSSQRPLTVRSISLRNAARSLT